MDENLQPLDFDAIDTTAPTDMDIAPLPEKPLQPLEDSANAIQEASQPKLVNVVNPQGEVVSIKEEEVPSAVQNFGYKVAAPEEIQKADAEETYGSGVEQVKTAIEGALDAATFGLSTGVEKFFGVEEEAMLGRRMANPAARAAGQVAGLVGTAFLPGVGQAGAARTAAQGAQAAAKVGLGTAEAAAQAAKVAQNTLNPISAASILDKAGKAAESAVGLGEATGLAGNMARWGVRGAAETALFESGDQLSRAFLNDPEQTLGSAAAHVGLSTLIGGAMSAPFGAVAPLWKATSESKLAQKLRGIGEETGDPDKVVIPKMMRKALSYLGGVPEEVMEKYVANRELFNSTPEFQDVALRVMSHLEGLQDNVARGAMKVEDAAANLDAFEKELTLQFKKQGFDAQKSKALAEGAKKEALLRLQSESKDRALAQAPKVHQLLEQLRDDVVNGSTEAYNVLERSGAEVSLQPFFDEADKMIAQLRSEAGPNSNAIADKLESYIDSVRSTTYLPEGQRTLDLVHYSPKGYLNEIDPSFAGTGFDAGTRRNDLENKLSHYYIADKPQSPRDVGLVAGAKNRVQIDLTKDRIYDFSKDPLNVIGRVSDENNGVFNLDMAINKLRESGFSGFTNPMHPEHPNAVWMWKKQPTIKYSPEIRDLADSYAKAKKLPVDQGSDQIRLDPSRGAAIAKAYEAMKHEPNNPAVKKAYDALINETLDQWQAIKKSGLKITKITDGQNPYPNGSADVIRDIRENNHLYYFPTEAGFGSDAAKQFADHPMLRVTGELGPDGEPMLANDVFRIVHDYFGHAKEGNAFGPKGEERAWFEHMKMYSKEAQKALTTETRGQNSWVNFGPKGFANRTTPEATVYADQKAGLLPDWVVNDVTLAPKKVVETSDVSPQFLKRGAEIKQMIQALDRDSKYNFGASQFDNSVSAYYKRLRRVLDQNLKSQVPEYRAAMQPLAKDTELLQRLSNFDTPEGAVRRIGGIKRKENYINEMGALRELEQRFGADFIKDIDNYANPELYSKLVKALPELEEARRAAEVLEKMKDPIARDEMLMALREQVAKSEQARALQMAQEELKAAKEAKQALSGWTPASAEGKLRSAMRGRLDPSIKLEELPPIDGESVKDLLERIRVMEAFEKTNKQGSTNVNLFGMLGGGLLGHVLGESMHTVLLGTGVGGMIGRINDYMGPDAVKKILDFYMDHSGKDLMKLTGVDNESAIRIALAKVLDAGRPVSAASFTVMAHYAASAIAGEEQIEKDTKKVFDPSKPIKVNTNTKELKKKLDSIGIDQASLLNSDFSMSDLDADAQNMVTMSSSKALQYLQSQRPNTGVQGALDSTPVVDSTRQAAFERTLSIAESPLNVLAFMQRGTITAKDVQDLQAMYPGLYEKLANKLTQEVIEMRGANKIVPYQTRLSLSVFLATPLDSTMSPENIAAAQMQGIPAQPNQGPQGGKKAPKGTTKGLPEMAKMAQTPMQARQSSKTA